jgi:hypothetical protein
MKKICINMDTVFAAIAAAPIVIQIDGRDHAVKEMSFGEVLVLERLGNTISDDKDMIEHMRSLFVDPPAFLDELEKVSSTLHAYREIVAAKLGKTKAEASGTISINEAQSAFGRKLPKSIADFAAVERRYSTLVNQFNVVLYAISRAVAETTPGNALRVAKPMIENLISPPDSATSAE